MRISTVFVFTLLLSLFFTEQVLAQRRSATRSKTTTTDNYVFSGGYRNEVGASTTYGEITSTNSTTYFRASGSYKYLIARGIQIGGLLEAAILSGNGQSQSSTGIIGTFTYNFKDSWNISDSFFAEVGLGMTDQRLTSSAAPSKQVLTYTAFVGKHIPLFDKVRYTPKVGFRKAGDLDMAFILVPLNLTISY